MNIIEIVYLCDKTPLELVEQLQNWGILAIDITLNCPKCKQNSLKLSFDKEA